MTDLQVTVLSPTGMPLMCDGCGDPATGSWNGKPRLCCDKHNPVTLTTGALPAGFTYRSLPAPGCAGNPMVEYFQVLCAGI